MKVLVSGGTGLVGRYVLDALIAAGHEVIVGTRSSTAAGFPILPLSLDPTRDQSEQFAGIDTFIHLAFDHLPGRYRGGEGDDPARFRTRNRDGSVKLFEDARAAGVKRCIFLSSRAVYDGLPAGSVLTEDMALSPTSLYGRVKLDTEQALAALSSGSFATTSLRATGVYGHHRPNKWDELLEDYLAGKPIAPRAGSEVHGDDLADAIRLVLEQDGAEVNGRRFNVSDIVTDRREILALFSAACGLPQNHLPEGADHASVAVMDTGRLGALGWHPGGRKRLKHTLERLAQSRLPGR
ncbi:NAD-dependent epimerase/dehydratase family protein [Neorhizobium sp. NPDC001467]|uniref:NAD-dependent epimerase/dehydratase family protein n=1 Tax=Neorhizobium sp. NPDC001467 TaxID=3390595 RepID=UPI003D04153C